MKNTSMNRQSLVSIFTEMLLAFGVLGSLLTSPFLVGCGESLGESLPETATVMVEISSPKVLKPADALQLIISTDFQGSLFDEIIYNTKEEFSITQDFNQTFQLDPNEPRIFVQLSNFSESVQKVGPITFVNPRPSVSVRLTILIDGEVEHDTEKLLTSGSSIRVVRSFSQENIIF